MYVGIFVGLYHTYVQCVLMHLRTNTEIDEFSVRFFMRTVWFSHKFGCVVFQEMYTSVEACLVPDIFPYGMETDSLVDSLRQQLLCELFE